jgi:hypothetical protein
MLFFYWRFAELGLREKSKRDSLYLDRGGRFGENVARGGQAE